MLYPTCGRLDPDGGHWHLTIRGVIFSPGTNGIRRRLTLRVMRRLLHADAAQLQSDIFQHRIRRFLAIGAPGRRIVVQIGDQIHALTRPSGRDGRFVDHLVIPVRSMPHLRDIDPDRGGWLDLRVLEPAETTVPATGRIQLIGQRGVSVISDIDDTIKISEVSERRALLANTFLRQFAAVPGMAETYQRWDEPGRAFHYVSSSPWQLFDCLNEMRCRSGFPPGTFHLRAIRFGDPRLVGLFMAAKRIKKRAIAGLIRSYPQRQFVLVGDSGQRDPEIYGAIARRFGSQISAIYIRCVARQPLADARCQRAFRGLDPELWRAFEDPAQLPERLPTLASLGSLKRSAI